MPQGVGMSCRRADACPVHLPEICATTAAVENIHAETTPLRLLRFRRTHDRRRKAACLVALGMLLLSFAVGMLRCFPDESPIPFSPPHTSPIWPLRCYCSQRLSGGRFAGRAGYDHQHLGHSRGVRRHRPYLLRVLPNNLAMAHFAPPFSTRA